MDQEQPQPVAPTSPIIPEAAKAEPKSGKAIWIVVGAILLAALGGVAFWYGSRGSTTPEGLPTPTPALVNLPTPSPSPSPNPSPKVSPRPTPKPTAVSVSPPTVTPTSSTTCPQTFTFKANITTNAAGTITYKWERSDGATAPNQSLTFASASTQEVTTTWTLGPSGTTNGWQRVHVLTPNDTISSNANFTLTCP